MTKAEVAAFNSGVLTVLALAERTAASMEARMVLKPTRYNFAAEALRALAEEGRALLKGGSDGLQGEVILQPNSPNDLSGAAAKAREAYVARIPAGDDGNFGLTDDEIMRPSRETIIGWLKGRTPMLASHWSRIAGRMLTEKPTEAAISAAE